MPSFSIEHTVLWGESDPFGLVYYPRMLEWINDAEHAFWREAGHPVEKTMVRERSAFVMGEVQLRFTGPAACGDRVRISLSVAKLGERTLAWDCRAENLTTGGPVNEGRATRVYAHLADDGALRSEPIPAPLRAALDALRHAAPAAP